MININDIKFYESLIVHKYRTGFMYVPLYMINDHMICCITIDMTHNEEFGDLIDMSIERINYSYNIL